MALAATMIRCLVVATSHSALLCHCCVDSLVCRQRHGAHTRARARFSSIFRNFAKSPSIFPHSVQFYFLKCCLCIARNAETNVIKEAERKTERKKMLSYICKCQSMVKSHVAKCRFSLTNDEKIAAINIKTFVIFRLLHD